MNRSSPDYNPGPFQIQADHILKPHRNLPRDIRARLEVDIVEALAKTYHRGLLDASTLLDGGE